MQRFKVSIEGIGPANCPLTLKKDKTFLIVNASNYDEPITHWLLFARADGQVFFADPPLTKNNVSDCLQICQKFHEFK